MKSVLRDLPISARYPRLGEAALFRDIRPQDWRALVDRGELRHLPDGTEVLSQGYATPGMFLVADGLVSSSVLGVNGGVALLRHSGPGETLGEAEVVAEEPCSSSSTTVGPATLIYLRAALVTEALQGSPLLQRNFAGIFCARMGRTNQVKLLDQFHSVEQRIAAHLLLLGRLGTEIRHSQGYIAALAGCSRQTVNRVLRDLEARRLILKSGRSLRIIDEAALAIWSVGAGVETAALLAPRPAPAPVLPARSRTPEPAELAPRAAAEARRVPPVPSARPVAPRPAA